MSNLNKYPVNGEGWESKSALYRVRLSESEPWFEISDSSSLDDFTCLILSFLMIQTPLQL